MKKKKYLKHIHLTGTYHKPNPLLRVSDTPRRSFGVSMVICLCRPRFNRDGKFVKDRDVEEPNP